MSNQKIVAFDIIGTCFSLEKPRQQLLEIGSPAYALELWFAQALRDAFGFSHAGKYRPFKEVLQAELPRTLQLLDVDLSSIQLKQIMGTFGELELHHGAKEAFQTLTEAGWTIVALTNGSQDSTHSLLERAGVQEYFTEVFSCDAIAVTKPHPDVYKMIKTDNLAEVWLVAAHAWDIAGAKSIGMKTVFVKQLEKDYLEVYPQPQIIVENLLEAACQIIKTEN